MGNRQHRQEIIPIDSSDSNESRERLYGVFAGLVTVGLMLIGSKILEVFGTKPSERTQENKPPDQSIQSFELQFERIYCSLKTKKGLKVILDGTVHGHIRPGRMMAILGPSGAGKSTLLHALAGRVKYSSKLELSGRRIFNGSALSENSGLPVAFVEQDVPFFSQITVRETLEFRVRLKLGNTLSSNGCRQLVDSLIGKLGLEAASETIVGDTKRRGISGGERKRLSIASVLIESPSALFLDEPTSGLDSTSAASLIRTLRKQADERKSVVAVIHQPSQYIFSQFDDVLVLSDGKLMYTGERSHIRNHITSLVGEPSDDVGEAEFVLDSVSKAPVGDETRVEAERRFGILASAAHKEGAENDQNDERMTVYDEQAFGHRASLPVQFDLLLRRSVRETMRSKATLAMTFSRQIFTAIIYGSIYDLGLNQASVQDRIGLMSLIAIGTTSVSMAKTVRAFPKEKAIVSSEMACGMYLTFPYFLAKAISEIPVTALLSSAFAVLTYYLTGLSTQPGKLLAFVCLLILHGVVSEAGGLLIGAISPSSDIALVLFPIVNVLNIIFDGKNISIESIPSFIRWLPKAGSIRWAFEGLCINEFLGLEFEVEHKSRGPSLKTGEEALARYGLGESSLRQVFQAQITIALGCWCLSYVGLSLTRQRFMKMSRP